MKLFEVARKKNRGILGLVSDAQYEAHLEAKIKKHDWEFSRTLRRTGQNKQLVVQKCSICGKQQEIDPNTGRVQRR